jgi:uncharacterized alpha-E superfamily protein
MLSRVADSIFWMSRYIERAENVARFIDVNIHMILDLPVGSTEQWEPLVITSGDQERFATRYATGASKENVIQFLAFDSENPNSIVSCLRAARENARSVREIMKGPDSVRQAKESPHEFFTEIKMASHLFTGLTETTMSHGEAWHFSRLGRLLERADKTTRLVDVKYFILLPRASDVGTPFDDIQWSAVLRSASAFEMYRKRHGRIAPDRVTDFLLLDREFPRAVHYCLIKAEESLHAISGTPIGTFCNPAEQRLGQLRSELGYARVADILAVGLHQFLDSLQIKLNQVGDAVFETFFALRPLGGGMTQRQGVHA